jgi:hypothetical protein
MAAWPRIFGTLWDFSIAEGYSVTGDSAVGMYWNPVSLQPGQSLRAATYYGISGVDIDTRAPFAVGLTGPLQLLWINRAYSPNPFTVLAYIENSLPEMTEAGQNVFAEMLLPAGMELAPGETARHALGTLEVGANTQTSWQIRATGTAIGEVQYQVRVGASNTPSKDVARTIFIPDPNTPDLGSLIVLKRQLIEALNPIFAYNLFGYRLPFYYQANYKEPGLNALLASWQTQIPSTNDSRRAAALERGYIAEQAFKYLFYRSVGEDLSDSTEILGARTAAQDASACLGRSAALQIGPYRLAQSVEGYLNSNPALPGYLKDFLQRLPWDWRTWRAPAP